MYLTSLLFYFITILFVFYLCREGESRGSKKHIIFAYFILWLISVIRFDIGNDYDNYVSYINEIVKLYEMKYTPISVFHYYDGRMELSLCFVTYVFQSFDTPYFWVIAFYSTAFYIFLYLALDATDSHSIGLLLVFISGFLFCSWDWIRQGLAIVIVLYSFTHLLNSNKLLYFIYLGIAVMVHYSAFVGILFIIFNYFNIKNTIAIALVIAILFLYLFNVFNNSVEYIGLYFRYLGIYDAYSDTAATIRTFTSWNYKIRTIFYSILWTSIIFVTPTSLKIGKNALFIGIIIFIIGSGSLAFTRIAWFFIAPSFCLLKDALLFDKSIKLFIISIIIVMCGLLARDISINKNCRGCSPYETIFSEDFDSQRFRIDD